MHKRNIVLLLVFVATMSVFSGCSLLNKSSDSMKNDEYDQKNAVITVTGRLSQNGALFFITDSTGMIHDVETYAVSFAEYVGKTVTVSGQYSGNTLYVTEITE